MVVSFPHSRRVAPLLISLLILWAPSRSQSQRLRFAHLGIEEGLSNEIITTIVQDADGFLWFGTEDGLNKYDGYTFTVFKHNPDDSLSISGNMISALCLDPSGNLWIGTDAGLDRFDRERGDILHVSKKIGGLSSLNSHLTTDLKFDRSGLLWIASAGRGVYSFDPVSGMVIHVTTMLARPEEPGDEFVSKLLIDHSNRVWLGWTAGVGRISSDRKGLARFNRAQGDASPLSTVRVTSMAEDVHEQIWIGTLDGGLFTFDEHVQQLARVHIFDKEPPERVMALLPDEKGMLWIGTFERGLVIYDPIGHSVVRYENNPNDPKSIASDRIYRILQDRSGSIWVGTWKGGVSAYHPFTTKFEHLAHAWYDSTTLSDNTVWSICEDRNRTLWVGTDKGGLDRYDKQEQRFHHYRHNEADPRSISTNTVRAICEGASGELWIATEYDGLDRYDSAQKRFVHFRHDPADSFSLSQNRINALCLDRDGDLWVGGNSLDRYDHHTARFVHYDPILFGTDLFKSIPRTATAIQSMAEDHSGKLWIAMFPLGLFRLDKRTNTIASYSQPSASYHVYVDQSGTVWVGSFGHGLCRYNASADSFDNFTELDGLPSNFVKGILSDDRGNLWLSTSKGLSRFDPGQRTARNYDPGDGVQAYEFRSASCFKGHDGKLYFGGVNGLNAFHPDSVRDNPFVPPVVITRFRISGKPFVPAGRRLLQTEIELSHEQNTLEFEFVGLNFSAPQKNRYSYMLEGLDKEWVSSDTRRYVNYTQLDAGAYVFRVRASNNDGVWNESGASIHFVIHPPFWKTWWFIGFVLVAASLLIYGVHRYRITQLLEIERTRSAIATDLHDDIGTSLTNIALFSDLAQRDIGSGSIEASQRLQKIAMTSRSLLDSMNDIVWSIKPANDALEQTILRMEDYAVEMLEENGIDLHVKIPNHLKTLKLPMTVRKNLFLIFKEAIGNVLKHSGATHVDVVIASNESGKRLRDLQVSIIDNGKGFDPSAHKSGNGLSNMRLRALDLNGTVTVVSDAKQGTSVALLFPLKSHK